MKILNTDYRWLVGSGHRSRTEATASKSEIPPISWKVYRVASGTTSVEIPEEIDDAYTALRGAQHFLTHIHTLIDARAAVADEDVALTASRGEVRAAEKTQSRRMERARQSGDYDEVVG